jgi:ClpP class serine protease
VDLINLLWLFFVLASLQPAVARQMMLLQRRRALALISRERGSTVITIIHRQEQLSLLGFPIVRYIDIDDAESVLMAIRETPPGRPIDVVLHTPGGMVLAAQQIAAALADHDGPVTAIVPHYAMSGGTLIALAADQIVLEAHAALGPVDPQLGQYPAASIIEASKEPGDHDDQTLIMADVGAKAIIQVETFTRQLLARHSLPEQARETARIMSTGTWTHDHPLLVSDLRFLGLPVAVGVPPLVRDLMTLYPQPRGRTPAVEYVPGPPGPSIPRRREVPAGSSRGANSGSGSGSGR